MLLHIRHTFCITIGMTQSQVGEVFGEIYGVVFDEKSKIAFFAGRTLPNMGFILV